MIIRGIDSLEIGLEVEDYLEEAKDILSVLADKQEAAKLKGVEQEWKIGNLIFKVHPGGIPFYKYRLTCKDFFLFFSLKRTRNLSPVKVKFLSGFLWSFGVEAALSNFLEWFNHELLQVKENKISRIDIATDFDTLTFEPDDIAHFVSRAKEFVRHWADSDYHTGNRFSGITIGKGKPLLARIYNKSMEIKKNPAKLYFETIWSENGWDTKTEVWRLEFQLRREFLKEVGVSSLEDYLNKEYEIWAYLTGKWLSFRIPHGESVSRWPERKEWKQIREKGIPANISPAVREVVMTADVERLLDQCSGVALSLAAKMNLTSPEDVLKTVAAHTNYKLTKRRTSFLDEINKRKDMFFRKEVNINGQADA